MMVKYLCPDFQIIDGEKSVNGACFLLEKADTLEITMQDIRWVFFHQIGLVVYQNLLP